MARPSIVPKRRLCWGCVVLGLVCLPPGAGAVWGAEKKPAPAAALEIPAWAFDRGSARVYPNRHIYADYRDNYPELVAGGGGPAGWTVEYDFDFPVEADCTLHVRYVATSPRPVRVLLDGRAVGTACREATRADRPHPYSTARRNPFYTPPAPTWNRFGARWEQAGAFPVAPGRHTLTLTCRGRGPEVLTLRLESPVGLPKGWKPAGPTVRLAGPRGRWRPWEPEATASAEFRRKVERIPPTWRRAFMPPGQVNVATLREAIEATIARYGARWPEGPGLLAELERLARARAEAEASPDRRDAVEARLADLRRRALLGHPLLRFGKLLFVKRVTYSSSHIYSDHWDGARRPGGSLCVLSPVAPDGKVTELLPELSGGIFGRFDLSWDARRIVFSYKPSPEEGFRIYEVEIDPVTGTVPPGARPRQLTGEDPAELRIRECLGEKYRFEDCDPAYLPDVPARPGEGGGGRILFTSTRSQRRVFCFPSTVTSLYVMDADGGNIRCLSQGPVNEIAPSIMADGQVLYTRWEYVDKGFGNVQSLWSMYPDGTHSAEVYKNNIILPAGLIDARQIPGSGRIVCVGAPHCGLSVGPVILVDPAVGRRTPEAMTNLTPELGFPGMSPHPSGRVYGYFKEPYPLSETLFLVAHNPSGADHDPNGYGLYVLDAWGNRAELYRDPALSCFQPMPLRPRPRPPTIARAADRPGAAGSAEATLFLQDVYEGLEGVRRGRVRYIRVIEAIGVSWDDGWRSDRQGDGAGLQASAVSLQCDVNIKKIHGVAPVEADGSACFTVPAEKNLFFQALDANYMEIQRMRTFVNLLPGERRSCVGCHEHRTSAPPARPARPLALAGRPRPLRPQPGETGPYTMHYARDIRPILDRRCVACHAGPTPAGGLDLSGELTKLYDRSYEQLIRKGLVSHLDDGTGAANVAPEPPLTFGSHRSRLVERIRTDPCRAGLTREEFIRIVTWIDCNAPYYGTHEGRKNLKWKDDPLFRPMPPAGP